MALTSTVSKFIPSAQVKMKDASFVKRFLFGISLNLGMYAADRKLEKGFDDLLAKVIDFITWNISFRSITKK